MKTVGQIRRENLLSLEKKHGSLAELNQLLELPRPDSTLSQIKNQSMSSRGKPRMMGSVLARRIESRLNLPDGWMDNDHNPPSYRQQRIEVALKAMEQLPDDQLDRAIKILDTLAEPPSQARSGTNG